MDFKTLKANRAQHTERLKASMNTEPAYEKDTRYWRMTIDKETKVGDAKIRFLPAPMGEDQEYVVLYKHSFKGPGGWYIENSRTTLGKGEKDPVSSYNKKLWDSGDEDKKDFVSKNSKRKMQYISNILVIEDPANPENNGKVFLFSYGKSVFEIIHGAMHPEDADEVAINPFDLWEGATLRLRSRNKEGFVNYEKSKFESPSALCDGDDVALEELWKKAYPLLPEIAEDKFKSYEELSQQLARAMKDESLAKRSAPQAESKAVTNDDDDAGPTVKSLAHAMGETDDGETADFMKQLASIDDE